MGDFVVVALSLGAEVSGGIGSRVLATAEQMPPQHRVTLISSEAGHPAVRERLAGSRVELVEVPLPSEDELGEFYNVIHLWSARVLEALHRRFSDGGPTAIECQDYCGEGVAIVQAKKTGDPLLADTVVTLRLATTSELCDVLNGRRDDDWTERSIYAMERYSLAFADRLVHGPGDVYDTYQRFYGADMLAPSLLVEGHLVGVDESDASATGAAADPLRILFLGRLERRKGILDLVRVLAHSELDGWTLTIAGGDTMTGSARGSVLHQIERLALADSRIELRPQLPHAEVTALIDEHDVVVSPSKWEAGPNVVAEALARNRPVLATPVGGQVALVVEGESGMLAAGTGPQHLRDLVQRAVEERGELRRMTADRRPVQRFRELSQGQQLEQYLREIDFSAIANRDRPAPALPTISVVIPYYRMHRFLPEALESVAAQSLQPVETLVVNDGSFFPEDDLLPELCEQFGARLLAQINSGVAAARNFGIGQTTGECVMFLDPDNRLHPTFLKRAAEVLAGDPETVYVSSWLNCIDADGRQNETPQLVPPISNFPEFVHTHNCASDAMALIRRSVFDAGFGFDELVDGQEDWALFRALNRAGRYGHVIPETLLDYRVRDDSKSRRLSDRGFSSLASEMRATDFASGMRWTAS
ncbi:MAG: glycosyltransferase [Solirubrobacterales bacterium]